ncbi:MAG: TetR family transcriptional regulator [Proteobacteria bacterium]|nr:TetR family transcriptional regulator [Pseudomonadota bacterium]
MNAVNPETKKPRMERDAVATRARILNVATREFARRGFEGATTDDIADKAHVNKRMIYHYFGSKERLYLAVLEEAYATARHAEEKLKLDADDPVSALSRLAEFTFDSFARDRTFISLLNTENRNEAKVLRKSEKIRAMNSTVLKAVDTILRQGEARGVFRSGLDAFQVWVSMVSLSYFYFSNIHTLSIVGGSRLSEAEALAARRRHVVDFVLAGVRA